MTDRELLELAAKAAGKDIVYWSEDCGDWRCTEYGGCWMPLDDDGDALRLAVKLVINVQHEADAYEMKESTNCGLYGEDVPEWCEERKGNDPYAATRRAIVRAAAEIGRNIND